MEISLNQLSHELQTLIADVKSSNKSLTITDDGVPVVTISPLTQDKRASFGCMRDSITINGDIIAPVVPESEWEVNR